MNNVLKSELDIDLVVFTGDQITGNNIDSNATIYWKELLKPCIEHNQRWAMVFGNHDDLASGTGGSRYDLMKFDTSFPLSLSQFGPSDLHGVSNYYLPVYPPKESAQDTPAVILYFLDSGGGQNPEIIWPDQVSWYKNVSKSLSLKYNKTIPAIAFFHIPVQQYLPSYTKSKCFGSFDDDITPLQTNTSLLSAFAEMKDVGAMFVGHNHGNDWCCEYENIYLCYGRHTGYGGYGNWARGSRIIEIEYNSSLSHFVVSTWVRMEDSTIIDAGTFII
eukprot:TRINITY_DN873_c0_g1_i2.p1 TRINITY_DN873_c0_g1~~TRINITY_DN873_c0_g1_i2.p1  ORF type:complete len:275 (+),score=39.15 TRINITY_DN873_c0_g1_i2:207-1031(+)